MLAEMKYLNVRHELPQIGLHQTQASAQRNGFVPAELHRDYRPPLADMAATLVEVDIDTYQCRKTYGFLNHADFAAKYHAEGLQKLSQNISAKTQSTWNLIKNAARPHHNEIAAQAKAKFMNQVVKWPQWEAVAIPPPTFTVTPSEIKGQMDVGSDTTSINATASADIALTPGKAETYIDKEGWIRMYVTTGGFDKSV